MGLESRISSPCLCDRHPSLISAHGSKTSEAVQGGGTQAGFFSKSHDSSSQILNPAALESKTPFFLSLRGSEATEAIHKAQKVDSSMDRHADKSARDDREKADSRKRPKSQPHQASGRILRLESGLCKASAEISLDGYRTSEPKQSTILVQKPTRERKINERADPTHPRSPSLPSRR